MSSTKWLWRITGIAGLISTLILISGFIYGIQTIVNPKGEGLPDMRAEEPVAREQKDKLQILALGDSLTKGVGDSKGEGYVGRVKKQLELSTGVPVYVWNFAVNGAETKDLLAEVMKPTAPEYIRQADLILLTIGGNDLNRAATAGATGQSADDLPEELRFNFEELAKRLPDAQMRLNQIVDRLAELNPDATIVYLGLYHPFAEFDEDRQGAAWIGRWNDAVFQAANRHPNVIVVPTYDLYQLNWKALLYSDHFHPNDAGYEAMAGRVLEALKGREGLSDVQ